MNDAVLPLLLGWGLHLIREPAVAGTEEHPEPERAPEHATRAVAPGALSALLEEIAQAPAEPGAGSERWPRPGAVIGRFGLRREIGRGGFGVVYEALDQELRRSVAFKLVRPGRLELGEEQLRREAEVIAQLSHPNLVTLFDVGRSEYGPYLVLELLRGQTLEERARGSPLSVKEATRLATEIARGLAHAHAHGVVHRDLKPSNVFLCSDGQVKLLDFGMSHAFGRKRVDGGTPAYMAPEQWRGAPEDERTDVFALGVMLFWMLSGELPFPGDDGGKAALSERRARVLEVPGEPALAELVGRMLEKDPTRRPRDGGEARTALASLLREMERTEPAGLVRTRRPALRQALLKGAAAALLAALALAVLWQLWPRPPPSPPVRAIAVMPFDNRSDSPDNQYLSDGLTEEVLNLLTRLRELKVAASTSTFAVRNLDIPEIAKRLHVDVVLKGTVRRDKDRLRVGAELIDARSGFRVWSNIYDQRLEDVFAIQDDIARRVVGALDLVLARDSETALEKPRAANLAAYDLYLRARSFLRLPRSEDSLEQATSLFEKAIGADGKFAQAYAGLCDAWLARYELSSASGSFERAEKACQGALERDRGAGEVYVALGNLHLASGRYPEAEREFQQAAALLKNPVDAVLGMARSFAAQGRIADAEREYWRACELDPAYWSVHQRFGNFLFELGRYPEAAREYGEVITRTPDNARAHNNLGAAYFMAGDFEKAAAAWRASLKLAPTRGAYSNIGSSYFYLGRFEEAAAMYAMAVELTPEDHRLWGNLGDAYAYAPARAAEASAAYQKAATLAEARLRISETDAETISFLAHYSARLDRLDRARQLVEEALRHDSRNMYVHYNAALVLARLGSIDAALGELARAVELGYQRQLLAPDPGLAPLRQSKRFEALVGSGR